MCLLLQAKAVVSVCVHLVDHLGELPEVFPFMGQFKLLPHANSRLHGAGTVLAEVSTKIGVCLWEVKIVVLARGVTLSRFEPWLGHCAYIPAFLYFLFFLFIL